MNRRGFFGTMAAAIAATKVEKIKAAPIPAPIKYVASGEVLCIDARVDGWIRMKTSEDVTAFAHLTVDDGYVRNTHLGDRIDAIAMETVKAGELVVVEWK